MTKRLYLKAVLMAASPLKLSSGDGWATDADVVVDAQGTPFIPGTTLAVLSLCIDVARWFKVGGTRTPEEIGALHAGLVLRMVGAREA